MVPVDQFLLIDDAAKELKFSSEILRQGIACGLIPLRLDNTGTVRVHKDDIPTDLSEQLNGAVVRPELHATVLADELASERRKLSALDAQRSKLEALVLKQGDALARVNRLIDGAGDESIALVSAREALSARDAEVEKLSSIVERTFQAMETREKQVVAETAKLTRTTDQAMNLLERAVREGELSAAQLNSINEQVKNSASGHARLEQELDQRNSTISEQHGLIERMVSLAEQTASDTAASQPRKQTFWQRLFGGGKGI